MEISLLKSPARLHYTVDLATPAACVNSRREMDAAKALISRETDWASLLVLSVKAQRVVLVRHFGCRIPCVPLVLSARCHTASARQARPEGAAGGAAAWAAEGCENPELIEGPGAALPAVHGGSVAGRAGAPAVVVVVPTGQTSALPVASVAPLGGEATLARHDGGSPGNEVSDGVSWREGLVRGVPHPPLVAARSRWKNAAVSSIRGDDDASGEAAAHGPPRCDDADRLPRREAGGGRERGKWCPQCRRSFTVVVRVQAIRGTVAQSEHRSRLSVVCPLTSDLVFVFPISSSTTSVWDFVMSSPLRCDCPCCTRAFRGSVSK